MTRTCHYIAALAALAGLLSVASFASAQTAPSLGSASSYAVLAGSTVTNTGGSTIAGDLGVSPGAAITGFPPGTVVAPGAQHAADASAAAAQTSLTTAYNDLAGQTSTSNQTGVDLGGQTLLAGVYTYSTSAQLTGTVTLNAQGNANAVFVFQIGSTLTTASNSTVAMINGGQPCNVFWQVGSSATLGTGTHFVGNILALTSITLNTNATVAGRALARNGAVTLDTNNVSASLCNVTEPSPTPPTSPAGCPDITLSPITLPAATVGVPYSQQFTAGNGTRPYLYTTNVSALPAGMALSSAGLLTGTPTSSTPQTFNVRATDALGCLIQRPYAFVLGVAVPTLPQVFAVLLALGLLAIGYEQVRRRRAAG